MSAEKINSLTQKAQIDADLLDAQAIVREYDEKFLPLDKACELLESALEGLTQSPSSFIH